MLALAPRRFEAAPPRQNAACVILGKLVALLLANLKPEVQTLQEHAGTHAQKPRRKMLFTKNEADGASCHHHAQRACPRRVNRSKSRIARQHPQVMRCARCVVMCSLAVDFPKECDDKMDRLMDDRRDTPKW